MKPLTLGATAPFTELPELYDYLCKLIVIGALALPPGLARASREAVQSLTSSSSRSQATRASASRLSCTTFSTTRVSRTTTARFSSCELTPSPPLAVRDPSPHTIGASRSRSGSEAVLAACTDSVTRRRRVRKHPHAPPLLPPSFRRRRTRNDVEQDAQGAVLGLGGPGMSLIDASASCEREVADVPHCRAQERFRSVTRNYYRSACGAVVVYDITRCVSFVLSSS